MLPQLILVAVLIILVNFFIHNERYRWFYILAKTYKRDFRAMWAYAIISFYVRSFKYRNKTVPAIFSELVKEHPQKVAFYFEDETWTFAQVDEFSNKVARYFQNQGFKKGDCIALMLENRVEYVCIWLGLSKIGVVTALINTNLISDPLKHSIKCANCKALIFGSVQSEPIKNITDNLKSLKVYQFHENPKNAKDILPGYVDLRLEIENVSGDQLENIPSINSTDPLIYIYTSGTTGLPKAAIVTNIRFIFVGCAAFFGTFCKPNDIMYVPLPLYHSAGGMLALSTTLLWGVTLAIRKKFSASNYWKDCEKYKCTRAQYIGEMCRYILAVPQKEPIKHHVNAILGSGLKPQIWKEFVDRFGIQNVYEYYGATEGISNMCNMDSTVGSVGFIPRYARSIYPVTLIKCNEDTGEPIRDKNGHCIECKINEAGLVIAKINEKEAVFTFKGYSDQKETEKKILRNVFRDGDKYFNSGDVLICDELGNFFFKDRTGDTFRWKGENVSTSEVEAVVSNIVQLNDAVVYGVEVPNIEGRAGMVAIVDTNKVLDIDSLSKRIKEHLPKYAIPLFVRVVGSVPLTGTYKLKKVDLRAESYNIDKIKDDLYFYHPKLEKYIPLTRELYDGIMNGEIRL